MVKQGWFIGIGSNIEPSTNMPLTLQLLLTHFPQIHSSAAIQTPPVGMNSCNHFINLVVYLECHLQEPELVYLLKNIEEDMGRPRNIKNRKLIDRTADLDPLCYVAAPVDSGDNTLRIPREVYLNGPFLELAVYLKLLPPHTPIPPFKRIALANNLFGQKATTIYRHRTAGHKRIIE